jgi:hypothetical protein
MTDQPKVVDAKSAELTDERLRVWKEIARTWEPNLNVPINADAFLVLVDEVIRLRQAADADGWRELDSAPIDKPIMGAWFGSPDYTEVSPVIYCSERGKWMNPDALRDEEYTKPDMWRPYPLAPKHRDVDQDPAANRGECNG